MRIEAAPMGLAQHTDQPALEWMPTGDGAIQVRAVLRELIGKAVGA
jgi:hypothetical protein